MLFFYKKGQKAFLTSKVTNFFALTIIKYKEIQGKNTKFTQNLT